jgi:hypothetical protein
MSASFRDWSQETTILLPGDVVSTQHGLAIITQAERREDLDAYAVWHLPGAQAVSPAPGVTIPPRSAWYGFNELTRIGPGFASTCRAAGLKT